MRFEGTRKNERKLDRYRAAARREFENIAPGPGMASRDTSGWQDPFEVVEGPDGQMEVTRNPWTEARNNSPYKGMVNVPSPSGETTQVPDYWANPTFMANLGTTGFDQISERLSGLQDTFGTQLGEGRDFYGDLLDRVSSDDDDDSSRAYRRRA